MRANDFLNSLGVTTHIAQGIDPYQLVEQGLQYLGIRHFRDDGTTNSAILSEFCNVHSTTGATMSELPWGGDLTDTLAFLDTLAQCGALLDVEGQNEPNNQNFTYNGQLCSTSASFLPCAQFQRDFYAAAKSDPNLANLPMFAETEPGAEPDNAGLQFLAIPSGAGTLMPDGTKFADYANLHNYVHCNGCSTVVDNQAWNAEEPTYQVGSYDGLYGEFTGSTWWKHFTAYPAGTLLPRVTTETGWDSGSISEDQQGKLMTNVYLSAYARGWSYTFVFQMFNESAVGWPAYGFFVDGSPLTPKAMGLYTHNLTAILADTDSTFTPTPLAYSITGQTSTVHSLPMQKGSGTYELAVWDDRPVGERTDSVTINLPGAFAVVNVYDVTSGTSPIQILSNVSSVPLTLTDHALLVEFGGTLGQ